MLMFAHRKNLEFGIVTLRAHNQNARKDATINIANDNLFELHH
jgi:hypothetical protein